MLNQKMGPKALAINSIEELNALRNENEVVVLGLFRNEESNDAKLFDYVAKKIDTAQFLISSSDQLFSELKVEANRSVIFFREVTLF